MYPTRMLRMQPTRAFYFPTPRLRQLKRVPPRAAPYRVAIGAAVYSSCKKLMTDKTLRLYRNSPESREH
ncbi:NADH-ubiquinone reductase complex 1 MLRQ subunit [Penicillium mononematosum]|uniref:NADH-ubiquinone reductase complex 1 MLRQ subunit n=1 Tax=Penicillium mononematosum TaxID=268346 RepID=UPI00254763D2|nr:NADH-ubiquinone reductase complex 1 MLRQ subunit [Penicillium mononematosum]KAJ6188691.1 NADH-ubiquinone reductase complex 1 MLRQ subunit [Penicillium mononematosum]